MEVKPLRHLLLIGEYDLGIDEKNRISLPADIRKSLNPERDGGFFYLVPGRNRKPWMYPERYYEEMVFQLQSNIAPGKEQLDFDHVNFALADKITWDGQGRMLIPEKALRRYGLGREVTMIGARNHLEIWNRPEWDARREALWEQSIEIGNRMSEIKQP